MQTGVERHLDRYRMRETLIPGKTEPRYPLPLSDDNKATTRASHGARRNQQKPSSNCFPLVGRSRVVCEDGRGRGCRRCRR